MKTIKRQQPVLLQIAHLGNPIVSKKAKEVNNPHDKEIQQLINDMVATCQDADSVGIAAPQVYKQFRLFIVASHPNSRYPHAPRMKPLPIINPEILSTSTKKVKDWEGCLSIPGIRGLVPRYSSIVVEYTSKNGKKVKRTLKDFVARIFQHEYDHLEGKVFLERVENAKEFISEKEYQKMIKSKLRAK